MISVGSLMAGDAAMVTDVGSLVTLDTTLTVIVGILVVKAIALNVGSSGPGTRPLTLATSMLSH